MAVPVSPAVRTTALALACAAALLGLVALAATAMQRFRRPAPPPPAALLPVRAAPARFPPDTHLPPHGEGETSGSIDLGTFSAGRDLIYVDDPRVWWESDHDTDDTEDDHTIHVAMEVPLRRLIEAVASRGGTLKVQDTYRPSGLHNPRSLHREGRAIDLTCDELGLEELARLCWASGFDWVYYEATAGLGAHVHCSVRR
jgi:hypothetical protein